VLHIPSRKLRPTNFPLGSPLIYIELHGWHSPPTVSPDSLRPHCRPPPAHASERRSIVSFSTFLTHSHRPLRIMSRRVTPGQAAQNQQTIKSLLKLESNKICADCKRNKRECPNSPSAMPVRSRGTTSPSLECGLLTSLPLRSAMGFLESRYLHLHSLLGHSPWYGHTHQSGQVRGS
jgi:hypothetical protein